MGNRPSSTIIYGFDLSEEIIDTHGIDYNRREAWEDHVTSGLTSPACCEIPIRQRSAEQRAEVREWHYARQRLVNASAQIIRWGDSESDSYAIGVVLAHGDWDEPTVIEADSFGRVLAGPPDMGRRVAELCAWLGIEPQPCQILMLSSYG